ncbi:hypothetical protein LAZ67_5003512 [Cordylochernes scorpioides]|uniref:Uncharacterized protein n=1 Tax=Cordylochernes scorpioides TaxID=51811 RepID=A0ABY6KIC6_9ARAC|nr:hypothetical protein LAZ67_5003512 [Cordylochernes scorpioides]
MERFATVFCWESFMAQIMKQQITSLLTERGRSSLEDDLSEGRTKSSTTPKTIEKVHNIMLDDRRVKVYERAEAVRISEERIRNILH